MAEPRPLWESHQDRQAIIDSAPTRAHAEHHKAIFDQMDEIAEAFGADPSPGYTLPIAPPPPVFKPRKR